MDSAATAAAAGTCSSQQPPAAAAELPAAEPEGDTSLPRPRSPPAAFRYRDREDVFLWQVVATEHQIVMTRTDRSSIVLGTIAPGTVVRGWPAADAWVGLADQPGYMLSEDDGEQLLKRASAPIQASATGDEDVAGGDAPEAVDVAAEEPPPAEEGSVAAFTCFACGAGFPDLEMYRDHLVTHVSCIAEPWQAAVKVMAALPGAGSELWCPACPDNFVGRWSGSATKAPMLLRHLSATATGGGPLAKAHARLLQALVALLLECPPTEGVDAAALQMWAPMSRLLTATGPLLAGASQAAQRAMAKLQNEALGEWLPVPSLDEEAAAEARGVGKRAAGPSSGKPSAKRKKREEKLEEPGPKYDFYDDDIPMDVFAECPDMTVRTAGGVPVMDLLSSDDEVAPVSAPPKKANTLEAAKSPEVAARRATSTVEVAPEPAATDADESGHWL